MGSSDRLTSLQRDLLAAFFRAAPEGWFLTGGAALAGFWLHHRTTLDLDLFASSGEVNDGVRALLHAVDEVGATARELVRSVDFSRWLAARGAESLVVDLVRDRVPQLLPKVAQGDLRLDSPREIAANKLNTLVDRAEPRDLVDLRALMGVTGASLDEILADAGRKSLSADPATIAWVLSTRPLAWTALPEGFSEEEILAFRRWLEEELRRRGAPPR